MAAAILTAVLIAEIFLRRKKTGRSWMILLLPVCVLAGCWRAQTVRRACDWECSLSLDEEEVLIEGRVCSMQKRDHGWAFGLEKCVLYTEEPGQNGCELMGLLVYLDAEERPQLGSRVLVEGTLKAIEGARNPGEFDYRMYYRAKKQNYRMFAERFESAEGLPEAGGSFEEERKGFCVGDPGAGSGNGGYGYREVLYRVSVWAGEMLDRTAYGSDAGIYRAALLGDKVDLDETVRSLYQRNGIGHLLAISGLHLSMVSAAVYGSVRKLGLGYGKAGAVGGVLLCSYAVMTGAPPSVMRALVMVLFGYGAACFGRTYDLLTALGAAAVLILWDSPYQLLQAGTQLSFGAIVGIGAVAPCLTGWMRQKKMERDRGLPGEVFLVSLALQLTTVPIILYHFFQIPVYGILLNLAVVPLMGIVLASGAAGILLGSRNLAAGRFAMGSGHVVLRLYETLCRICSRLPGNTFVPGRPELWQIMIYYVCLAFLLVQLQDSEGGTKRGLRKGKAGKRGCCLGAAVGMALVLRCVPVHGLQAAFLDVGQGDGIVLRTEECVILIDGGSTDQASLGRYRLEPYLKSIGETGIDLAVVTHGDADHISGLQYLLEESEEIKIKCLALPDPGRGQEIYETLSMAARNRGAAVVWMKRGDVLEAGKLRMTCLYPEESSRDETLYSNDETSYRNDEVSYRNEDEDRNEHSIVLKADYGDFHMLLTGDMSQQGELDILEDMWASAFLENTQVLKVAHHGSKYSTGEQWLDKVCPRWAVISYGAGNRYGHPHAETIKRLEDQGTVLYETGESGAVILHTDGTVIRWNTWLEEK